MRVKYRYLVYEIMLDGDFQTAKFSSDDLRRSAIDAIETNYGILGMARMIPGLSVLFWQPDLRVVVFRCLRDYCDEFALAMSLSTRSPNNQDWSFRCIRLCARVSACRDATEKHVKVWEAAAVKRANTVQAKAHHSAVKSEIHGMLSELVDG